MEYEVTRGGYGLIYNHKSHASEFYDEATDLLIGDVKGVNPYEVEEMTEGDFQQMLEDNYIC